uniref:PDZ domain-containing protein n=1 Tax=Terrapene triunguis TaxID=2587831 RepID=A0A674JML2_9SAUR
MEGNSPTEKRRAVKGTKQHGRNTSRSNLPAESAEPSTDQPVRAALEPARLRGEPGRATHSILEGKVKALKEKRSTIKQGGAVSQERASLKKPKARKGKLAPGPAVVEGVPQDAVVEPRAQIHLYANNVEALKAHRTVGGGSILGCGSAEELWRLPSPGRSIQENADYCSENRAQRGSPNGLWGTSSTRNPPSSSQKSSLEDHGKPASFGEELAQARDSESLPLAQKDDLCGGLAPSGRLWRAESWDSLGSAASAASGLSLAEQVERNRAVLQEMLSLSRQNRSPLECATKCASLFWVAELLVNDLDWDSGVSLQDSEGAFVPTQELELSPRHEQAKQLLQRARMKARTSPLRASHDILPAVPQARDAGRSTAPDLKKSYALRDAEAHASGNLSDSSSGESSCGQPRKRGPSPSRVRFEDESLRDAEVRYLERLQLRQKRVLDSVLLTLGQSPLVSKPDLSDYINGDFHRKESGVSKAGPTALSAEGKCRACGSYLRGSAESGEPSASQQEVRGRTLGPRGSPLWILPSRQRVHTERIRETYIGDVTYIDDVDSALDSTDTSDSCRTDSEEAGPGSSHPQDARGRWPGRHQAPRGTRAPEKDPRGRKAGQEECRVNGGSGGTRVSDNVLGTSKAVIGENVSEERNSSLKDTLVLKEGQVTTPTANGVEALSKGDQLPAASRLAGKNSGRCDAAFGPVQQGHAHPPPPAQGQPSAQSIPGNRGTLESCAPAPQPANNFSQPRPATGISQQQAKQGAPCYNLLARVPVPPLTGKASSPVPYRKAVLTGSYRLTGHETGRLDQTSDLVTRPTSPPGKCGSVPEEQNSQHSPKVLSKGRLLALSTNNSEPVSEPANRCLSDCVAVMIGPSSAAAPSAAPSTVSSVGIILSLAADETEPTQAGRLPSGEAPVSGSHKPLDAHPEPKKPSASAASRKGGGSSASGLKKFFCTLSQSTKQKLGRFRCYSMHQIPAEAPSLAPPPRAKADATDCSNLKKAPSLQSLRLVSPFCQLRKASSAQNLHSLLGKADRSSFYLEGNNVPSGSVPSPPRKAGAPPRRSLSVDDIGAPDLVRTVGRVVEVFPDGTSQLELQRPPQGTFGFRVSSGNGRPDTGIYVQEMADTSTAKLYAGLLGVGDEILEVNGAKVTGLGLAHISELLLWADTLSIRVLKQRPTKR